MFCRIRAWSAAIAPAARSTPCLAKIARITACCRSSSCCKAATAVGDTASRDA